MVPLLLFLTFPNFNYNKINSLDDLKWEYRVLVLNHVDTINYKKKNMGTILILKIEIC